MDISAIIKNQHIQLDIEQIFHAQNLNKQQVRQTTAKQRIEKLKHIKTWIFTHRADIQKALFDDFKKPASETDNSEIMPVKVEIDHTITHLSGWMQNKKVSTPLNLIGSSAYIIYEPKGVALIISPWNFPFNLAICPLVSAIAAGCCGIIKPSEFTPHTSALISSMIQELFSSEEIAVVEGDSQVASTLLKLPFDHIFFTGSPAIGKVVMKAAAEHLTSVTLELGGKSPVIVDETANIEDAAEKIAWGKFINAGQTCVAPDYLFVHKNIETAFINQLKKSVIKLFGDTTTAKSVDYARIVNKRHWDRVQNLISDAIQQGANIQTGGITDESDYYISPTLLTKVDPQMKLMQEEIFGPLLPIISYSDVKDVTDFISNKEKPLALYIFSSDKNMIRHILCHTSSGGVCINDCVVHYAHPNLPFGGVNNSGIGKAHGYYGFLAFSNERAVLKQRTGFTTIKMLYPPYTAKVKRIIDLTLKWL
jgi:aldehyde dehydrogenase (NAD+)